MWRGRAISLRVECVCGLPFLPSLTFSALGSGFSGRGLRGWVGTLPLLSSGADIWLAEAVSQRARRRAMRHWTTPVRVEDSKRVGDGIFKCHVGQKYYPVCL